MKNSNAHWCEVRSDGDILSFKPPLVWRSYFGVLGFFFGAIAVFSAVLLQGASVLGDADSRTPLLILATMFTFPAFPCLYLALPYRFQIDFKRQVYETQRGLGSVRYGPFADFKNVFVQRIKGGAGYRYRIRLSWQGKPIRWVPILAESESPTEAEAFARALAERLEVAFTGRTR